MVVTSSLSVHIIDSVYTNPRLATLQDSLKAAVMLRELGLDVVRDPKQASNWLVTPDERMVTTHTTGLAFIGDGADILTFMSEYAPTASQTNRMLCSWLTELSRPTNFHNLDAVTDGSRQMNFYAVEVSAALPEGRPSVLDKLLAVLDQTPKCQGDSSPFEAIQSADELSIAAERSEDASPVHAAPYGGAEPCLRVRRRLRCLIGTCRKRCDRRDDG